MIVAYGRVFKKMLCKQLAIIQEKFYGRLILFLKDPHNPLLANHALYGEWVGCRRINVTGDIRAVFEKIDGGHVEFVDIGSHSELYS